MKKKSSGYQEAQKGKQQILRYRYKNSQTFKKHITTLQICG